MQSKFIKFIVHCTCYKLPKYYYFITNSIFIGNIYFGSDSPVHGNIVIPCVVVYYMMGEWYIQLAGGRGPWVRIVHPIGWEIRAMGVNCTSNCWGMRAMGVNCNIQLAGG